MAYLYSSHSSLVSLCLVRYMLCDIFVISNLFIIALSMLVDLYVIFLGK